MYVFVHASCMQYFCILFCVTDCSDAMLVHMNAYFNVDVSVCVCRDTVFIYIYIYIYVCVCVHERVCVQV